jgi:hypothetical protein
MICLDLWECCTIAIATRDFPQAAPAPSLEPHGARRSFDVLKHVVLEPPQNRFYMNYSWHLGLHSFTLHQTPCRSMLPGRLSTFIGSASIIAGADLHLCTTCSCKIQDSWYVCPSAGHNIIKLLMGEHVWELRIAPTFQVTQKGCQKSENMTLLMQILDQWFPRSACTFFLGKTKIMIVAAAA